MTDPTEQSAGYQGPAIVELMGHSVLAGIVWPGNVAGVGLIAVNVEAADGLRFTRYFGAQAIFSVTPVSETMLRKQPGQRLPEGLEVDTVVAELMEHSPHLVRDVVRAAGYRLAQLAPKDPTTILDEFVLTLSWALTLEDREAAGKLLTRMARRLTQELEQREPQPAGETDAKDGDSDPTA